MPFLVLLLLLLMVLFNSIAEQTVLSPSKNQTENLYLLSIFSVCAQGVVFFIYGHIAFSVKDTERIFFFFFEYEKIVQIINKKNDELFCMSLGHISPICSLTELFNGSTRI